MVKVISNVVSLGSIEILFWKLNLCSMGYFVVIGWLSRK